MKDARTLNAVKKKQKTKKQYPMTFTVLEFIPVTVFILYNTKVYFQWAVLFCLLYAMALKYCYRY